MTKLEQAYNYIEKLQIAEFFAFVKPYATDTDAIAMLTRLEKAFILGKTEVDFYNQLKSLANLFLENLQSTKKSEEKTNTTILKYKGDKGQQAGGDINNFYN